MANNSNNIFKNRRLVNKIMFVLAIIMVIGMLAFTVGPALFSNQ